MTTFRIIAIPERVAETVRAARVSPRYGHPAYAEMAKGYGPCRQCLRGFAVGRERRILFTYDAFADTEALPLPGPVFIHEESCARYPEDGGFPEELRAHALTLEAYGRGRQLRGVERIAAGGAPERVEESIERLLARPDVDYIHVRDTAAGCYDCRIERREPAAGADAREGEVRANKSTVSSDVSP
jgi:hypothetical protein